MERIRALLQGAAIVEQRNIARGRQVGIKAAAEQSDRRWDPKLGWIDYIEPNDQEEKEVQFFTL
jgi:hypothetical protein